MNVSEVGGQFREFSLHIESLSIPPDQCASGKSVTKMPHAAFSSECRVRENAEQRRLPRYFGALACRGVGII
jgi:hypothetical protein